MGRTPCSRKPMRPTPALRRAKRGRGFLNHGKHGKDGKRGRGKSNPMLSVFSVANLDHLTAPTRGKESRWRGEERTRASARPEADDPLGLGEDRVGDRPRLLGPLGEDAVDLGRVGEIAA